MRLRVTRNYATGFDEGTRIKLKLEHFIITEVIGTAPVETHTIIIEAMETVIIKLNKLSEL